VRSPFGEMLSILFVGVVLLLEHLLVAATPDQP
jgi:hypothetical protein